MRKTWIAAVTALMFASGAAGGELKERVRVDDDRNIMAVNKFGRAPNGVQITATDIWDLADAVPTDQLWVAPTEARIHQIKSSDAADDGDPVGVGARTIRVWGLTTWDTAESSEDIILNGTTDVPTVNSYVIIHRMQVLTAGTSGPNVGAITAIADDDTTTTATILAGNGQTLMAVYGVPSNRKAYIRSYYMSFDGTTQTDVDFTLKVNPEPDDNATTFLTKHRVHLQATGSSLYKYEFDPMFRVSGPAIIKMQAVSPAVADVDATAGFDMYLVRGWPE